MTAQNRERFFNRVASAKSFDGVIQEVLKVVREHDGFVPEEMAIPLIQAITTGANNAGVSEENLTLLSVLANADNGQVGWAACKVLKNHSRNPAAAASWQQEADRKLQP